MSFKEDLGEEGSFLPRIATGFGGGIGRRGSLCGAFTGSVMVLGLKFGRTEPKDEARREKSYALGYQFWDRFEKEFGSCICYELTGCHMDHPEERKKWRDAGGMDKCAAIVEKTARLLQIFLEEMK